MEEGKAIPIHRSFGRLALETFPAMLAHLALPHVGMVEPWTPFRTKAFTGRHGGDKTADKIVAVEKPLVTRNISSSPYVSINFHCFVCSCKNGSRNLVSLRIHRL